MIEEEPQPSNESKTYEQGVQKGRRDIANSLAHHFNNGITPVLGGLDLLYEDPNLPSSIKDQLERIIHEVEALNLRIQDLAQLGRLPIDQVPLHRIGDISIIDVPVADKTLNPQEDSNK